MGKIEQARAAIQEAEVADEDNEDVWVQVSFNPINIWVATLSAFCKVGSVLYGSWQKGGSDILIP